MDHLQSLSVTRPGPAGLFHLWGSLPGVGDKGISHRLVGGSERLVKSELILEKEFPRVLSF